MLKKILISALAGAVVFIAMATMAWQKRGIVINYIRQRNTPEHAALEYVKTLQKGMYRSMSSCATQEAENKMRNFAILSEPDLSEDEAVEKHLDELSSLLKDASFSIAEEEKDEKETLKLFPPVPDEKDAKKSLPDEKTDGTDEKTEVKTIDVKVVIKWKDSSSETVTLQMVKDKRGHWRCNTPF